MQTIEAVSLMRPPGFHFNDTVVEDFPLINTCLPTPLLSHHKLFFFNPREVIVLERGY